MHYPTGTIKYQSRPATVDMTSRTWGELTALSKGTHPYWRFQCTRGHVAIMNGSSVRSAAYRHEAGKGTPYMRCPECKVMR